MKQILSILAAAAMLIWLAIPSARLLESNRPQPAGAGRVMLAQDDSSSGQSDASPDQGDDNGNGDQTQPDQGNDSGDQVDQGNGSDDSSGDSGSDQSGDQGNGSSDSGDSN